MPTKSKTPALRSLRRKFLADQKPVKAPKEKLSADERSKLFDLIDEAQSSNHRLLSDSADLEQARAAFDVAKRNVEIAEADLANTRAENQRIHTEMAPLFHGLTA